ncbi:MAG: ABC transporter ATP-binding protein [Verrucomicrobia bacterium]|nr:ABC transporter ATP-binding protein [Verrucomicrobiota bacterium]
MLLEVKNLSVHFATDVGLVKAVDGIRFTMQPGETLAVVGESGSGKSVTALALTRLVPSPPARYAGGEIIFKGRDTLKMSGEELRHVRGAEISYIFQEPSTSLNPVFTVRSQIAEAIELHRRDVTDIDAEVERLLTLVGIRDPRLRMRDYPHQLSGGMQQRVMIAMALACNPSLLVADEPTTALDVTIQAQIMALLKELKQKLGMGIMLITHNFSIVADIADNIAVMFRGRIVEYGSTQTVLRSPQHPYTKALLECIPRLGAHKHRLKTINHAEIEAALRG